MAEGEQGLSSWIGGWLQTAKEKSTDAFDFVKRDLLEFTTVIQSDTTQAVSMTRSTISENLKAENAAVAKNKVQQGFTHFLQGISKALEVIDIEETTSDPNQTKTPVYDRAQARLHAVQVDPGTYCNHPISSEKCAEWLKTFDMEKHKGDISELLVSNAEIRALYTNLVPTMVSHTEFWQRYFYKVHQLQQDEARKLALMKRADECKEDAFSWDDDEDWSVDEEIEIIDQTTLAELVDKLDEPEESATDKPDVNDNTFTQAPKVPERAEEETHFRKAVTVEQEIGSTAFVDEQADMCPLNEQNVAELQVDSNDSEPHSQSSSEPAVDELQDIPATSNFVNSDSPKTEPVTVFEEQPAELLTKVTPSVSPNTETKTIPLETEEKTEEPLNALTVNTSESICLNEESLTIENDDHIDDHDDDADNGTCTNIEWKSLSESPLSSSISDICKPRELKTTCKGDMIVVGSLAGSPSSDASDILKDVVGGCHDDDWEQDFDVDITEEDLKKAQEAVKTLANKSPMTDLYKTVDDREEEDWESWE